MLEIQPGLLSDDVFIIALSEENEYGYTMDDFDTAVMNAFAALQLNT